MSNNNESLVVAQTILEQFGASLPHHDGSLNLLGDEKSLQFQLPALPASSGQDHQRPDRARPSDTYTLTFFQVRGIKIVEIADTDVYAEMLRRVFTERTGLECTLGTIRR